MGDICILNFNHTYENQDFYKKKDYKIIDLYDLKNVSRYCDKKTLNIIRKKLYDIENYKIKFIDSGNYHYISYLILEKIKKPFVLVLFDHHTDMQPSYFEELMSCGCWVKKTLDDNEYIEKVVLIGNKEELINSVEEKYKSKIICFSEEYIKGNYKWEEFSLNIDKPIYISIDKDVLNNYESKTDWDQGSLTLEELKKIYINICANHTIIGIDICGDSAVNNDLFSENNIINNKSNKKILDIIAEEESIYESNNI